MALSLCGVQDAASMIGYDRPTIVVNPARRGVAEGIAKQVAFNVRQDNRLDRDEWFVEYRGRRRGSNL
jgi:hypothetical protein